MKHLVYVLNLAKSIFYYHVRSHKKLEIYEKELAQIEIIYHENKGHYGYRRIHLTLKN
ncbi:transposase domain protein [Providencia alcalifaciens PAL-2]|nr:transposase domain protein [Providencia alcalifaciens PAL-2]